MKSIKYVTKELKKLHKVCPYLKIRYEFRPYATVHIIEVLPVEVFNNDKPFMNAQIKLEDTFEKLFPEEEILFMSTNSLVEIDNAILNL